MILSKKVAKKHISSNQTVSFLFIETKMLLETIIAKIRTLKAAWWETTKHTCYAHTFI